MQLRPRDGRPLSAGDEHQIETDLAAIAEEVAAIVEPTDREATPAPSPSPRAEIATPGPAPGSTQNGDRADFVIVTALPKEAQAVVSRLENCTVRRFQDRDIRTYHCGLVPIQDTGRAYRVVVVLLPDIGEVPAANAAGDAIRCWKPNYVLMVGIAGGMPKKKPSKNDLDLGDVVVANQIIGYEYSGVTDDEPEPRDRVYPASQLLLDRVRSFWDEGWTTQINVDRPNDGRRPASKQFVGPILSGNKVIKSTEFRERLRKRWPKALAVEMEGEGVFAAVFSQPEIRHALVIRSICDMADERKSDEWQEYAANAAAAFVVDLLKSEPVDPQAVPPKSVTVLEAAPGEEDISPGPEKISLAKLPSTDPVLFGRGDQLATLDRAWKDPDTNVVSLVAWGGVGKTALVNRWLLGMKENGYRGAERVYGWSFYSQGAAEGRQTSADPFIAAALQWFGDPDPTAGSPWDKGERLAELVRQLRTLLILDGLEPLQHPPGEMEGRLKDPGLCCLLRALARHNPGLCLLTTRLAVDDLKDFSASSVARVDLQHLSPPAGAAYLEYLGVKGAPEELEQAAREFDGHALALTLLGRYLAVAYDGDVRQRDRIPKLTGERKRGGHARRVIESYERWFEERPELDILRVMGLFDRPAEPGALEVLRAEPPIAGLTERLQGLSEADYRYAVADLHGVRLLAEADPQEPGTLDCHPLVREHFGEQLERDHPDGWREAHGRLYEYYKTQAPEHPDTLEEMMPLFAAVAHGCRAGRHQEAHDEVYRKRIHRGNEFFSTKKLGAFGAELAALASFFERPWRQPITGFSEAIKGSLLSVAGFRLRALGRLKEAAEPMKASLKSRIDREVWDHAARDAGNLSELHLTIGELAQALAYARQGVELADRSGDAFQRMGKRTQLADGLHQAGRPAEAEELFRQAEAMQEENQPQLPLLYSLRGYQYCDLLLGQGQAGEVLRRVNKMLEWRVPGDPLLDIALEQLALGRAHLLQARQTSKVSQELEGLEQAAIHLNRAVDGLRQAGVQEFIVRGLLARAALHRAQAQFAKARRDLEEALAIATRGGMRLHEADCHLEVARFHLARGEREAARESLAQAREMIEEMGYHRRDGEVAELEEELAAPA